ncbi:MAG: efflux RND transporter periplasmic adaptor subunit [Chitinophagaceae bacterium]|nr:efflux RND transporter periplasmic adaptor subunit [Chitinophagaceae bacterium]
MKQILPILFLLAQACFVSCKTEEKKNDDKKPVCVSDSMTHRITLDTARLTNISNELQLSGEVGFNENRVVKVFPFSSGQVMDVKVSLGDHVAAGQVLAVIRSADIAGNYSDLKTTASDIAIARRHMENTKSLYEKGISSEKEYEEAKENYQKALAVNQKINDALRINGGGNTNASGILTVKAPISGYIVEKKANAGSFIRPDNAENLFTISDLKDVWIWANVFETDIARVREGYTALVRTIAYPGKTFRGRVDKVSEVLSPDNKVMRIRINLPNEGLLLKPEMFTSVQIENTEESKAVSIPADAMVFEGGRNFVVVYKDKCNLQLREVFIIKTENDRAYIGGGLNAGEVIISKNQVLFYNAILENQ